MTINSAWCPVLHGRVTTITTLEGDIIKVICPEFEDSSKTCRVKKAVGLGGPLSQLLERVTEESLAEPDPRCDLA
jgi:hypothetical protein